MKLTKIGSLKFMIFEDQMTSIENKNQNTARIKIKMFEFEQFKKSNLLAHRV